MRNTFMALVAMTRIRHTDWVFRMEVLLHTCRDHWDEHTIPISATRVTAWVHETIDADAIIHTSGHNVTLKRSLLCTRNWDASCSYNGDNHSMFFYR